MSPELLNIYTSSNESIGELGAISFIETISAFSILICPICVFKITLFISSCYIDPCTIVPLISSIS